VSKIITELTETAANVQLEHPTIKALKLANAMETIKFSMETIVFVLKDII
jgi:hypothetical protein